MGRVILGIVSGYVLIVVLVAVTDRLLAVVMPSFGGVAKPPLYFFLMTLVIDFVFSIVGSYVCCAIARELAQEAMLGLIALSEVICVAAQVALWKSVPHWFAIVELVLYPTAIWIGSRLRPEVKAATI
jgi:hypothetical protein